MGWEKYVFNWEKWNFKPIGNFGYTTEFLTLLKGPANTFTPLSLNVSNANIS